VFTPLDPKVWLPACVIVAISWVPLYIYLASLPSLQSLAARFWYALFFPGWIIYQLLITGPVKRFYERLYPRAIFAIGDGIQRYEKTKSFRTIVLVAIILTLVLGIISSVVGAYFYDWSKK
jgi:hypothetical protein